MVEALPQQDDYVIDVKITWLNQESARRSIKYMLYSGGHGQCARFDIPELKNRVAEVQFGKQMDQLPLALQEEITDFFECDEETQLLLAQHKVNCG